MKILTNWPGAGLNSKFSYPRINVSPSVKGDWPVAPRGDATSAIALNQQHYWINILPTLPELLLYKN